MTVQRGDVVLLNFPFSDGSGAKVRPALVIQRNTDNRRLNSTVVALISSKTNLVGKEPGHILIDVSEDAGRESGLWMNSVVNVHSLFTLHMKEIRETLGQLPDTLMSAVDYQLRISLGL